MFAYRSINLNHSRLDADNVLVLVDSSERFRIRLCDLALQFALEAKSTPACPECYSAPELRFPEMHAGGEWKSDLWSAGMLLYFCAIGRHPPDDVGDEMVRQCLTDLDAEPVHEQVLALARMLIVVNVRARISFDEFYALPNWV